MTGDGPPATPATPAEDATGPGADVVHLVHRRGLRVPDEDVAAVAEYWRHVSRLRAAVEADLLADAEIAVTWSAAGGPDAG